MLGCKENLNQIVSNGNHRAWVEKRNAHEEVKEILKTSLKNVNDNVESILSDAKINIQETKNCVCNL